MELELVTMKLEFTVDGKPIGKARQRVTKRATYTPAATTRYEDLVRYTQLLIILKRTLKKMNN